MKCELCEFESVSTDEKMNKFNLEAHYFYVHRLGSEAARKKVR